MQSFLQRFALLVAGVLQGFDRLVFKGKLQQLYSPEGMHVLLAMNQVQRVDFKKYSSRITQQIKDGPCVQQAKKLDRFRYLNSGKTDKEALARQIAAKHGIQEGLVCVLQALEPCWTFDTAKNADNYPIIRGEAGKCSQLYHYFIHPRFGWMYFRVQTWFPFEIQIGINGREWLARQMDQANLAYKRSDNKILWVEDWQRAQELFDEQLQTDWVRELNALQRKFHPSHPGLLGPMKIPYNWTVFQSEWATDVAFHSTEVLQSLFDRWLRQAFLSYDSVNVMRFLGRAGVINKNNASDVHTNIRECFEGKRIKHWLNENSLKLYIHLCILRAEMTINNPKALSVLRRSQNDPKWPAMQRPLRFGVVDFPRRAEIGQQTNERYLGALATLPETRSVQELTESLTQRVPEPKSKSGKSERRLRALNPMAAEDAGLLTAISNPAWMIQEIRNRDLVAALYKTECQDESERRRRSARVTRLLRLLRAHGLLEKVPQSHRYQVPEDARAKIHALLAARNANPDELTSKAA